VPAKITWKPNQLKTFTMTTKQQISPSAQDELERLRLSVASPVAAARVWERLLTANQRRQLGGDLEKVFGALGTAGIWMRLNGVSRPRAIIDISRKISLVDEPTAEWLLGEFGERTPQKPADRPSWNVQTGQLSWHGKTIREIRVMRQPSALQRILDAFEAAGWLTEIPNPLSANAPDATHQALHELNRGLERITFHSKEGARTLYWEAAAKSKRSPSHPK
jgi:hypothetical protein